MFLDIGFGILWALFVSSSFQVEITGLVILAGILSALAPDIDMLTYALPKNSKINVFLRGHRGLMHRPIIWAIPGLFVFIFFGGFWTTIFVGGVLFHLIHDTIGLGWGIKWFWPFSSRSFRFFPDKDGKLSSTFFLSFTDEEKGELRKQYHNPNWVRDFYFTINPVSIAEYGTLLLAVVLLLLYLK